MTRLSGFALACVALVLPVYASAQVDTVFLTRTNLAVTVCTANGPVSLIRMELLDSAAFVEEIAAHERTHREDIVRDPTICQHDPHAVLLSEVHAYCVSDSVAVRHGANANAEYVNSAAWLVRQFNGIISMREVIRAWFDGCGRVLPRSGAPSP